MCMSQYLYTYIFLPYKFDQRLGHWNQSVPLALNLDTQTKTFIRCKKCWSILNDSKPRKIASKIFKICSKLYEIIPVRNPIKTKEKCMLKYSRIVKTTNIGREQTIRIIPSINVDIQRGWNWIEDLQSMNFSTWLYQRDDDITNKLA